MSKERSIKGFELIEKVGEGGMASVWKARQISLDRTVAIKILSDRLAGDAADIERFHTEARAAAKLKHSGIVQVYDASADDGMYYFVMEFVAGYTVGDWVRRKGRLSEKEALLVADCVASALGYAWDQARIVHCDIKPDNIMVDSDGTVKVADLGLARTISTMSTKGDSDEIIGTPAYCSPEQALGKDDIDCRSDIYSLGATLYHMLTGKPLFDGHPQEAIMDMQVTATVADPFDEIPGLSKGVCWFLERMLCKDRGHRESSWPDIRRDIGRVSRGLLPLGNPPPEGASTIQRSAHRCTSLPASPVRTKGVKKETSSPIIRLGAVAGAAILVLLSVVIGFAWHRGREVAPAAPAVVVQKPAQSRKVAVTEDPVERRAREMYAHASAYEKENPAQYALAIDMYERVFSETRGTKYSLMAQSAVTRLETSLDNAAQAVFSDLRSRADALVADGKRGQAVHLLRSYDGPYAAETRSAREQWMRESGIKAGASVRMKRERQEALDNAREQTLLTVVGHILEKRLDLALSALSDTLAAFPEISSDADWQSLQAVFQSAQSLDNRILDSFARQAGEPMTVEFNSGPRQIVVDAVENGIVRCTYMRSTVQFGLDQIALRERLLRMGSDTDPDVALAKGVLALASSSFDHALRFFANTHPLVSARLIAGVQEQKTRHAEAEAAATASQSPEQAPEPSVAATVPQEPGQVPEPSEATVPQVPDPAPVVATSQRVRTEVVVAALLARNPQASPDSIQFSEEDGVCRILSIRDSRVMNLDAVEGLTDLREFRYEASAESPGRLLSLKSLARLPLQSLTVRYAKIRDIYELRGMPLTYVDLTGTAVRDLGALQNSKISELVVAGTPITDLMIARTLRSLTRLDASGTSVNSGTPLETLPLQQLILNNTRISDFSFVRRLPQLEYLSLDGSLVRSLGNMITPSLRSLSINQTRIEDLSPLASSGISRLELANTPVQDFRPLKGLALQHLRVSGTTFSSLETVAAMPLAHLDISGTRVTSLEPLTGKKTLTSLHLAGSRVATLQPLKGMSFGSLGIQDIPARDPGPLWGAAIEEIWMDNPGQHVDFLRSLKGIRRINGQDVFEILAP
jgi:serine/threonine-protein kinase